MAQGKIKFNCTINYDRASEFARSMTRNDELRVNNIMQEEAREAMRRIMDRMAEFGYTYDVNIF